MHSSFTGHYSFKINHAGHENTNENRGKNGIKIAYLLLELRRRSWEPRTAAWVSLFWWGPGLQPLLCEQGRVWCELKSHLPRSMTLCHPGPLYRAHDQGTQTTRLRDFHTGYYIVFDDLTFTSFSNQSFFSFFFFGRGGTEESVSHHQIMCSGESCWWASELWNVGA